MSAQVRPRDVLTRAVAMVTAFAHDRDSDVPIDIVCESEAQGDLTLLALALAMAFANVVRDFEKVSPGATDRLLEAIGRQAAEAVETL